MTKIMLVEDDKSLREIYGVRLLAEGYDIVSAGDGEEALAVAIKERPVLIITDVMMPKISGFDMLDILRSTTETRNIKVIMMTALSSDEHRQRGEQMGADRYLVKSQVGIEDVVRVVHEVLGDTPGAIPTVSPLVSAPVTPATPPAAQPVAGTPRPMAVQPQLHSQPQAAAPQQAQPSIPQPRPMPPASVTSPPAPSTRQRIIQPINDPTSKVNINELLDRELAKEMGTGQPVATAAEEKAAVQSQLQSYAPNAQGPKGTPALPPIAIDAQGHVNPTAAPTSPPSTSGSDTSQQPRTPGPIQTPPRAS